MNRTSLSALNLQDRCAKEISNLFINFKQSTGTSPSTPTHNGFQTLSHCTKKVTVLYCRRGTCSILGVGPHGEDHTEDRKEGGCKLQAAADVALL